MSDKPYQELYSLVSIGTAVNLEVSLYKVIDTLLYPVNR
jgi:hypothetical protein